VAEEDECPHGFDLRYSRCASCRREGNRQALRSGQLPPDWFQMEAGYDSQCPGCRGFINQGERIFKTPDEDRFVCQSCALEVMP